MQPVYDVMYDESFIRKRALRTELVIYQIFLLVFLRR